MPLPCRLTSRCLISVKRNCNKNPGSISCRRIVTSFTPEKGKAYEAVLNIPSREGVCMQTINKVSAAAGSVALIPVAVEWARACE